MSNISIDVCDRGDCPKLEELLALYDSVGWTAYTRHPSSLEAGVRGSLRVVTARSDDRLVGLARVVGDGATICYLQDVLVDPGVRRTGLGRRLVEAVFEPFAHVRQHVLITDEEAGQKAFYESLGFTQLGASTPGCAFVRFTRG
ncbi:GNAT family N-acetyltransferase [Luteococcus sp. H138]|uniref:GNAT family N-acetyltransferase n=1 Tax=unclassified Luteococcus TaxID=2639923 RepID=UPI00313ECCD8